MSISKHHFVNRAYWPAWWKQYMQAIFVVRNDKTAEDTLYIQLADGSTLVFKNMDELNGYLSVVKRIDDANRAEDAARDHVYVTAAPPRYFPGQN